MLVCWTFAEHSSLNKDNAKSDQDDPAHGGHARGHIELRLDVAISLSLLAVSWVSSLIKLRFGLGEGILEASSLGLLTLLRFLPLLSRIAMLRLVFCPAIKALLVSFPALISLLLASTLPIVFLEFTFCLVVSL